jgi:WD40 repeat protein
MPPLYACLLAFLVSTCLIVAQDSSPPAAKKADFDEKTVRALIGQLGDDAFEVREAAHKRLTAIGEPALDLLRTAGKENADFEVRQRLGQLIKSITDSFFVEVRRFDRPQGWMQRLAVTPDDRHVVALGFQSLRCLDLANGKETATFEWPKELRYSWAIGMSSDGQRVIAGCDDGVARVFEVKTGKLIKDLRGHDSKIYAAALLGDGKLALTGGALDKTVRVWDVDAGRQLRAFENVPESSQCVSVSPDGKLVAIGHITGTHDEPGVIRLWDLESGRLVRELIGHTKLAGSVRFSPDGKTLLSSGFDKTVRLWDVAQGKLLKTFEGHTDRVECAVFTPDGKRVISAGDQNNPIVKMWDVVSGSLLYESAVTGGGFLHLVALADGRHCVTGGRDGAVRVWQWKR